MSSRCTYCRKFAKDCVKWLTDSNICSTCFSKYESDLKRLSICCSFCGIYSQTIKIVVGFEVAICEHCIRKCAKNPKTSRLLCSFCRQRRVCKRSGTEAIICRDCLRESRLVSDAALAQGKYEINTPMNCTIVSKMERGYEVSIEPDDTRGFLFTPLEREVGCRLEARFLYISNARICLRMRQNMDQFFESVG